MSEPVVSEETFVLQMVEKYRALLLKAAGLKSVNVDGQTVDYVDLEAAYEQWRKKLQTTNGKRPLMAVVNLRGAE